MSSTILWSILAYSAYASDPRIFNINCQSNDCGGKVLQCGTSYATDVCKITCSYCRNTTFAISNAVGSYATIDCLSDLHGVCNGMTVFSAAPTMVNCGSSQCENAEFYFGDIYEYFPNHTTPNSWSNKNMWIPNKDATFNITGNGDFSLAAAHVLCHGNIHSCAVDATGRSTALSMNMTCNASTADCNLLCQGGTGCFDTTLKCEQYQSCECTGHCDEVTIIHPNSVHPTIAPTLTPTHHSRDAFSGPFLSLYVWILAGILCIFCFIGIVMLYRRSSNGLERGLIQNADQDQKNTMDVRNSQQNRIE